MNGGPLAARATVVKRGQTIGLCDVDVSQGGELVAKGLFTYILFTTPERS
jgi:acyl-coenzyme A thioesterase PaaI-like protein